MGVKEESRKDCPTSLFMTKVDLGWTVWPHCAQVYKKQEMNFEPEVSKLGGKPYFYLILP